jgi:hypothetical protein
MTRRRVRGTIQVRAIGPQSVEFVGCDRAVRGVINTLGVRRFMRHQHGHAWLVPQSVGDDVMALLEHRGFRIEIGL